MANNLFANLNAIKPRLIDYLYTINENINWTDFLNRYGTLSDTKILKRIRSLIWIDKSIEYDSGMDNSIKLFDYYMNMLSKFMPILYVNTIHIIPPNTTINTPVIDEFIQELNEKYSILRRILDILQIEYSIIDMHNVDVSIMKILCPLGSISYKSADITPFESFKGIIIPDAYDNLCFNNDDELYNNFVLNIRAMMLSADDVSSLIKTDYTMFHISI